MRVRAASRADFEAVTELLELLGRPKVTDATREDCRAVFEEQVVDPNAHHIVAEEARRRGIGAAMLDEVERRARARECHGITLESGYQRAEAHHLYRTFQMRDTGKQFYKPLRYD